MTLRRWLGALSTLSVLFAAAVLAGTAAGEITGRWRVVPVLSGSMEPAMSAGSAAIVTPIPASAVTTGDVIVYHAPIADGPLLVHRVVEVLDAGGRPAVRTAGDASARPDPWVARLEDPVAWKVQRVVPAAGYAAMAVHDPGVRLGVAAAAAALLCVMTAARLLGRPGGADPSAPPVPV